MQSERLKVRPCSIDDCALFLSWWNDKTLMKDVGFPEGLNLTEKDVEKTLKNNGEKGTLFVIETHKSEPIGEMSYSLEEKGVRIGMKIANVKAQGKGYGKESLILFCAWLFNAYAGKDILIDTLTTNTRAIKLYESVGACTDGVKKAFWTNPHGTVYDAVFFTLTEENFNKNTISKMSNQST